MTTPADQAYELTFEERSGYLYVRVATPHMDPSMTWSCLEEVAKQCADIDCKRLLIDRDIPSLPTTHVFAGINDLVGMTEERRVAVVNRHAAIGEALRTQIEAGASSGANVAYFDNIPDAEAWLLAV